MLRKSSLNALGLISKRKFSTTNSSDDLQLVQKLIKVNNAQKKLKSTKSDIPDRERILKALTRINNSQTTTTTTPKPSAVPSNFDLVVQDFKQGQFESIIEKAKTQQPTTPDYAAIVGFAVRSIGGLEHKSKTEDQSSEISQWLDKIESQTTKETQKMRIDPYEAAIDVLLDFDLQVDANAVLSRMKKQNIKPRNKTYSIFFDHYLKKVNKELKNTEHKQIGSEVMRLLEDMKHQGLNPTTAHFNKILEIHMKEQGGNKFAWQILENANKNYFQPNGKTFDLIINASSDLQQLGDASGLMFAFGHEWNRNTLVSLLKKHIQFRDWATALTLANNRTLNQSNEFFNVLIHSLSTTKADLPLSILFSMFDLASNSHRKLSNKTASALLEKLGNLSNDVVIQKVWFILTRKMGIQANKKLLTQFIVSSVRLGGQMDSWWGVLKYLEQKYKTLPPFSTQTLILKAIPKSSPSYEKLVKMFGIEETNNLETTTNY